MDLSRVPEQYREQVAKEMEDAYCEGSEWAVKNGAPDVEVTAGLGAQEDVVRRYMAIADEADAAGQRAWDEMKTNGWSNAAAQYAREATEAEVWRRALGSCYTPSMSNLDTKAKDDTPGGDPDPGVTRDDTPGGDPDPGVLPPRLLIAALEALTGAEPTMHITRREIGVAVKHLNALRAKAQ